MIVEHLIEDVGRNGDVDMFDGENADGTIVLILDQFARLIN